MYSSSEPVFLSNKHVWARCGGHQSQLLRRMRQEDLKKETRLGNLTRPCLKIISRGLGLQLSGRAPTWPWVQLSPLKGRKVGRQRGREGKIRPDLTGGQRCFVCCVRPNLFSAMKGLPLAITREESLKKNTSCFYLIFNGLSSRAL